VTADGWLPWLLIFVGFLEANGRAIGAVADFTQIALFACALVTFLRGLLAYRHPGKAGGDADNLRPSSVAAGHRSVSAGGDITGPVITGDHSRVSYELGEELYERLRSEARPAPLGAAPPLPEAFVGRVEDLSELKRGLGRASEGGGAAVQVLTAVHGWPGVGKTAVAAALAHDGDVRRMFPDAVLFASLGQDPDVLSTILAWARSAGAGDLSDAESISEASGRLRAAMMDRRALLILDDVWEADHALPLAVGGRHCATLVTTRQDRVARELSPHASGVYRLGLLGEEESLRLLERLAPAAVAAHPEEARELVRELDGLPLALRVAGGLLEAEAALGFGVAELLVELRGGRKILEAEASPSAAAPASEVGLPPTVAALLWRSTERLKPLYRERFALLGVLPSRPVSFGTAAAQDLWATKSDPRMTLHVLVGRGLVEPAGEGRFQVHSLLSAFGRSLLEEDAGLPGIEEARRRYLKHYEVVLGATDHYYCQGGEAMRRALEHFDSEWACIRAAHALAASRMEMGDEEAARFVSDYASAGTQILAFRMAPRERIRWMELALSAARRLGDHDAAATHNANLGTAYSMAGDKERALPHFRQSLVDARKAKDRHAEAAALGNLAVTSSDLGDLPAAFRYAEDCLALAREHGERRMEAQALGTLGDLHAEGGTPDDLREAVRCAKGQLDTARHAEIDDLPSQARAMRSLGLYYRELGLPWRAGVFFDAAARTFGELKKHETLHQVLLSHGVLCIKRGDHEGALGLFDRVIASATERDDGRAHAMALMNKGIVFFDLLGDSLRAEEHYRLAVQAAREAQDSGTVGDATWNLAQLLDEAGDRPGAVAAARDAVAAYASAGEDGKADTVREWLRHWTSG
jgi:tetratricopeptide (TPR) repeat protein